MTCNLKALGLTLCAIFALGVVGASTAAAQTFHSEKEKTIITGTKHGGATFGTKSSSLSVTCKVEEFGGTVVGENKTNTTKKVTVHPTYKECSAPPFGNATVDTDGCDYILWSETTSHPKTTTGTEIDSPVEVECTTGSVIKITAPGCTISIGTQPKRHGVFYTNTGVGSGRDITVDVTVDEISYTSSGFGCGLGGVKSSGSDGFLTGNAIAEGFEDLGPAVLPHQHVFTKNTEEGKQVGIWWE